MSQTVPAQVARRFAPRLERVYIVPNRYGFLAFGGISVLFIAAAWFSSPLAYLLSTLLLTMVLLAMVQCNSNLKKLSLRWFTAAPGAVGGSIEAQLTVVNTAREDRVALRLDAMLRDEGPRKTRWPGLHSEDAAVLQQVGARSSAVCSLSWVSARRGVHPAPQVRMASVFPFGMFYAWRWQELEGEFVVYPQPVEFAPPPHCAAAEHADGPAAAATGSGERVDFLGHRLFRVGDSLAAIDWKARARGRPALIKEFYGADAESRVLTWDDAVAVVASSPAVASEAAARSEQALSQLSAWVVAMGDHVPFTLELPGLVLGPAAGRHHRADCLRQLAVFDCG